VKLFFVIFGNLLCVNMKSSQLNNYLAETQWACYSTTAVLCFKSWKVRKITHVIKDMWVHICRKQSSSRSHGWESLAKLNFTKTRLQLIEANKSLSCKEQSFSFPQEGGGGWRSHFFPRQRFTKFHPILFWGRFLSQLYPLFLIVLYKKCRLLWRNMSGDALHSVCIATLENNNK